ncbi:hypothetical protein F5Y16DRAFT_199619 [Xylariaceae sp. FL0255]|nr:hypothetical protein F5Y16DRAFT_199619 [Xylariaceae sp. FL0255]
MQIRTALTIVFATAATAQSIPQLVSQIPSCAVSCIDNAATSAGCSTTDYSCQCNKIETITSNSLPCVQKACSSADLTKTTQLTTQICLAVAQGAASSAYSSAYTSALSSALSATSSAGSVTSAAATTTTSNPSTSATTTPSGAVGGRPTAAAAIVGAAAIFAVAL